MRKIALLPSDPLGEELGTFALARLCRCIRADRTFVMKLFAVVTVILTKAPEAP